VARSSRVRINYRRFLAATGVVLLVILTVGLVAPFIKATAFSAPIRRALETSLGRQVEFTNVHFLLLSGPGFSLSDVVISEDPRYGGEPFAFVPTLQVHLRIDKLLLGQVRISSLRLLDPSLNLVKKSDGGWNVVELVQRLSAPRRAPLNLFPSLEVRNGRIDFKFGTRKATVYVLDSDLTIYPERSGRLYVRFSGSPARTDRAGNGFGNVRGTVTWYAGSGDPRMNQLEANLILDQSNVSEMATLFEGHDIGIHGTVSSEVKLAGPITDLHVNGALRLADVHRWDLLPSSGEAWQIGYGGKLDLLGHNLALRTLPARTGEVTPVALEMQMKNFLGAPAWSLFARVHDAPAQNLVPLARRMGLAIPPGLVVEGMLEGAIGLTNSTGLSGAVSINNATATLPNLPPFHAGILQATISPDRIHLDPATIQDAEGTLQVGGDYSLNSRGFAASFTAEDFRVTALKSTIDAWFGSPPALSMLNDGTVSGSLLYRREEPDAHFWSGQFQFTDATLAAPGLSSPLRHSEGRVTFDDRSFDLSHLAATIGQTSVRASYHSAPGSSRPDRVRIEMPTAEWTAIERALAPALQPQSLFARLPFVHRAPAPWLANRNVEGDFAVNHFSVNGLELGELSSHFIWESTNVDITSLLLKLGGGKLAEGKIDASGSVDVGSYQPHYSFNARLIGLPWAGGSIDADAQLQSFGIGSEGLQHVQATGSFSGDDLSLSADDSFTKLSGSFDFSLANGWPDFRLSKVEGLDGDDDEWSGEAVSQSDGRLIFDFRSAGRQKRIVSSLARPHTVATSPSLPVL